jgi:hypothetical protein
MKARISLSLFLPIFILVISSGCASLKKTAGGGYDLSYKMSAGDSFTMKTIGTTTILMNAQGQDIDIDGKSSNETTYKVTEVRPDGSLRMEMVYVSMSQSTQTPMGDSDADYSAWIGKKTQFTLSPKGVLSEFAGFDQLSPVSSSMGETVNGDQIMKGLNGIFFKLPDHPVNIGESWTDTTNDEVPLGDNKISRQVETTYTVSGIEKKDGQECLKIDVVSNQKMSGELEQQNMQMKMTRDTKSTGAVYFAPKKGFYVSADYASTAKGEVDIPAAGATIPQNITSNTTITNTFK